MYRVSVVHRRIGREHCRARANDRTAFRHDLDTLARLTMGDIGGIAMKSAAASLDGAGEAGQIPGGMKAALVGETERAAGVETGDGRAVVPFDVDAGAPKSPIFLFQIRAMLLLGRDETAVHAREIAGTA